MLGLTTAQDHCLFLILIGPATGWSQVLNCLGLEKYIQSLLHWMWNRIYCNLEVHHGIKLRLGRPLGWLQTLFPPQ